MKHTLKQLTYVVLALLGMSQDLFCTIAGRIPYNKDLNKLVVDRLKTQAPSKQSTPRAPRKGIRRVVQPIKITTAQLMQSQRSAERLSTPSPQPIFRSQIPQLGMPRLTEAPHLKKYVQSTGIPTVVQSFLNFDYQESGQYGPSADASVGTQQFILGSKGRIRSFDKTTGQIDGVLNISHDHFFSPISNGGFTADPNIIYDPASQRWFLFCNGNPNLLLAMSDGDPITADTVWTFITVDTPNDPEFEFYPVPAIFDYTNLGVDAHAVLCSVDVFNNNPFYISSAAYVIPKKSLLSGGPVEIHGFRNLVDQATLNGPFSTQGVQNFDPNPQFSYFAANNLIDFLIGFSEQFLLGTVTYTPEPVLSPFVSIPVNPYIDTIPSPVLGTPDTHMVDGDTSPRLIAAHIRNNVLWIGTYIGVDNTGASTATTTPTRNAVRYWAVDLSGSTPIVTVDGTLFAASPTNDYNQRHFLTPSIMTNPLGQVIIGATTCGANEYLNASVTQVVDGVAQTPVLYTQSSSNYYAQEDWEFAPFARWGDHTRTSPDPIDNTIWTCQLMCPAINAWGGYAAQVQPG